MIHEEKYKKAIEIVKQYEKQLSSYNGTICYILQKINDNTIFVTTDENFAKRQYESGEYIMYQSQIINPL